MSYPDMFEKPKSGLNQGDIFVRFEGKEIPKGEDRELAFIILTYTCDLEHPEDLNYVLFSPIYDFNKLIEKYLDINKNKSIEKIKDFLIGRIKELFNNETRFYFFLSPIPNISKYPAYVDLGQIVKLHKQFTKDIITNKKVSLNYPWREKLGWMTGNLFNRVALEDIDKSISKIFIETNIIINNFFKNRTNDNIKLLKEYLDSEDNKNQIIKKYFLPLCLENTKITRDMLKKHLSGSFNKKNIKKTMTHISTELSSKNNEFLREIISFKKKYHKLENFKIHDEFKNVIKDILDSNEHN